MCLNNLNDFIFAEIRLVDRVLAGKAIINLNDAREEKSISPCNVVCICVCHNFGAAFFSNCVLMVLSIIYVWHFKFFLIQKICLSFAINPFNFAINSLNLLKFIQ